MFVEHIALDYKDFVKYAKRIKIASFSGSSGSRVNIHTSLYPFMNEPNFQFLHRFASVTVQHGKHFKVLKSHSNLLYKT